MEKGRVVVARKASWHETPACGRATPTIFFLFGTEFFNMEIYTYATIIGWRSSVIEGFDKSQSNSGMDPVLMGTDLILA